MKKNKGYTLIEIVVALAVASLFMVAASGLIMTTIRIFIDSVPTRETKIVAEGAVEIVADRLSFASAMSVEELTGDIDKNKLSVAFSDSEKQLYINGEPVMEDIKQNITLSIDLKASKSNLVFNANAVYTGGNASYDAKRDYQVNPIKYMSSTVAGKLDSTMKNWIVYYETGYNQENYGPEQFMRMQMKAIGPYYDSLTPEERREIKNLWDPAGNEIWKSNDHFRRYLRTVKYGGSWPEINKTRLPNTTAVSDIVGPLYMQVTYESYVGPFYDKNIVVYASTFASEGNWLTQMIYNHDEGVWYCAPKGNRGSLIATATWPKLKEQMAANGWIPVRNLW